MILMARRRGPRVRDWRAYESSLFIEDFNNCVKVELAPGTSQFAGSAPPPSRIGKPSVNAFTFTYPSRRNPA